MSAQPNKDIVRKYLEEVYNKGNFAVIDQLFATDWVGHDPANPQLRGPEAYKQQASMYRTAFPDLRVTIEDQFAEGDKVVTRWTARGTHKQDLMGIAPTGKQTVVTGINIAWIVNGKIKEQWDNWDTMGLMQQLGVVPQMPQPRKAA